MKNVSKETENKNNKKHTKITSQQVICFVLAAVLLLGFVAMAVSYAY